MSTESVFSIQKTQAIEKLSVDGVFIAIGHTPNTSLFENQLDMKSGYIQIKSGLNGMATATTIPGRICLR